MEREALVQNREGQNRRRPEETETEAEHGRESGRLEREHELHRDGGGDAAADHHDQANAEPLQSVGDDAEREYADEHADVEPQQVARDLTRVHAGHVPQPWPHPQRLISEKHAIVDEREDGDPPEETAAVDLAQCAELIAQISAPGGRCGVGAAIRHDEEDQHRDRDRERRQHGEDPAPADHPQQHFHRHRRRQRTETAERHHDAVDQRQPRLRPPRRDGLERRHQASRNAQSDTAAGEDEKREILTDGEQRAAERRDQQQARLHAARPVAVQQDAERNLKGGEGDEVDAGEKPQIRRREADFRRKLRRDDGIHRAVEIG